MRTVPDLSGRDPRSAGSGAVSPLRPMPPRRPRCDDTWLLVLAIGLIVGAGLYAVVTA